MQQIIKVTALHFPRYKLSLVTATEKNSEIRSGCVSCLMSMLDGRKTVTIKLQRLNNGLITNLIIFRSNDCLKINLNVNVLQ